MFLAGGHPSAMSVVNAGSMHYPGNEMNNRAASRVTSQNQISIPAEIRKRFGIRAGTELIWEEVDGELTIRPKRFKLEDVQALLADAPSGKRTLAQLRSGKIAAISAKVKRGRSR